MKITGTKRPTLTVNGTRCAVLIDKGPWIAGVNPDTIKVRAKNGRFPDAVRAALTVENQSDTLTDFFVGDDIRLLPGHQLYDMAKAIA
jgi:hypothetical protein